MELKEVQTMGKSEKYTQTVQLQKILDLYSLSLNDVVNIIRFLDRKPRLLPILIDARGQIKRIFGDVPVRLKVEVDPEEGWETLSGIIKVQLPVDQALLLLNRLENEWFVKIEDIGIDLNFDIEIIAHE